MSHIEPNPNQPSVSIPLFPSSTDFVPCIEDINVGGEKESQPVAYFSEHLHGMRLKYSTYGKAIYVLHLIIQGILNKRNAQSTDHKGQNGNLVMFKDQNTRRITLYRFWTSRRPRVRIKRKCIDLEHKEYGFHQVTWSASNHKKRAKLIGFSSDSEIT
ncbi:hypothetical protein PIB30_084692 [Stylosanthes scabra]|uniref:Reverse transcriptase RNase H-like domain-containing protein n=1 Tax=Stylosanthes scabra TaxID=79078 RepID=A0ABU6UVB9_9FABA|nr:hypothetical protein [Stylosanthes scabra]